MEECALAIALAMARTPEEQARIEHLANLRTDLMERRRAHSTQATVSDTRGLSREEMAAKVKALYMEQGTSDDVLRVHARTHFTSVLMSQMQAHDEAFARAWIDAIGDAKP